MWQVQDKFEAMSDDCDQEKHQGALQRHFFGREKLLVKAVDMVEQVWSKGGMMFVEGGPGEGKTVFMVKLIHFWSFQPKFFTIHQTFVLSCFFFLNIVVKAYNIKYAL